MAARLMSGVFEGTTTCARMPRCLAASATAAPWLPEECVTTPLAASSSDRLNTALQAPVRGGGNRRVMQGEVGGLRRTEGRMQAGKAGPKFSGKIRGGKAGHSLLRTPKLKTASSLENLCLEVQMQPRQLVER